MPLKSIRIEGDGFAAWCCARLLTNSGFSVSLVRGPLRKRPWILVSDPVQRLLCELAGDAGLFRNAGRIRQRIVAWGPGEEEKKLPHSAAIIAEQEFLDRLWPMIPLANEPPDWTIRATSPGTDADHLSFGSRRAQLAEVELPAAREACWIESFENGWLFLIASATSAGLLIAVGAPASDLLAASRSIAPLVSSIHAAHADVPAGPRILSRMCGEGWLACGSAAMMLDPLCGDGAGHAVREAILATAVLRGGAGAALLDHYQSRLRIAFERHLALCRGYYISGRSGPWWTREIALLDEGLAWAEANRTTEWRYRLDGLDLHPLPI